MEDVEIYPAWAHSPEEVIDYHAVDPSMGLDDEQVEERREQYGYNELEKPPAASIWAMILEQFDDTLVKVRLCCSLSVVALLLLLLLLLLCLSPIPSIPIPSHPKSIPPKSTDPPLSRLCFLRSGLFRG